MKKRLTLGFLGFILIYALFQGRSLILGPRISLDIPEDNTSLPQGVYTAKGVAKNATVVSINDHRIYTDPKGNFESKLIAHEGVNIIKLAAIDRFGRERVKLLRIVGN